MLDLLLPDMSWFTLLWGPWSIWSNTSAHKLQVFNLGCLPYYVYEKGVCLVG